MHDSSDRGDDREAPGVLAESCDQRVTDSWPECDPDAICAAALAVAQRIADAWDAQSLSVAYAQCFPKSER